MSGAATTDGAMAGGATIGGASPRAAQARPVPVTSSAAAGGRGLRLAVRDLVVRSGGEGGRVLLDVPSLDVAPGEVLAIAGPSGAGKSTLLHALSGLVPPDRGRVVWGEPEAGTDLAALGEGSRTGFRSSHLGLVFQDHLLFDELDAQANAALARAWAPAAERAAMARRVEALLASLGLPDDPGRGVASYSGGERQRVAVARALAADPPAVLADEPTASLDRASAATLSDVLMRLAEEDGRTLIVVTHDEALMSRAHRVLRLVGGRPAEARA